MVAKAVAKDHAEEAAAARKADDVLSRGEVAVGMVTKQYTGGKRWKPGKVRKTKVPSVAKVSMAARRAAQDRRYAVRAMVTADLSSPDPETRETAMAILRGGLV